MLVCHMSLALEVIYQISVTVRREVSILIGARDHDAYGTTLTFDGKRRSLLVTNLGCCRTRES